MIFTFDSSQVGAPVLSGSAGALRAVIKACLVDGFGAGRLRVSASRCERLMVISSDPQKTPEPSKAAMSKAPRGIMGA